MGLDISLVKIEDNETPDCEWLLAKENPELEEKFSSYKRRRHFQYPGEEYYDDVYYYRNISYQRKGVNKGFYEKIENDKCIVEKEELQKISHFVDQTLKEDFKANFIEKFIEGLTFVIVNW